MAVEKSALSAAFSGDFPIDLSINPLSDEMSITMEVEARGKPGPDAPEVTISMSVDQSRKAEFRPLKP
jgi:hypothetical protein